MRNKVSNLLKNAPEYYYLHGIRVIIAQSTKMIKIQLSDRILLPKKLKLKMNNILEFVFGYYYEESVKDGVAFHDKVDNTIIMNQNTFNMLKKEEEYG